MINIQILFITTILFFSTQTAQAGCILWVFNCPSVDVDSNYDGMGSDFGANIGIESTKELRKTLDEAIKNTGKENRKTLEKLRHELDTLMQSAGNLYDDKLNLTVDKLDIVTTKKLHELDKLVNKTNALLQDDIELVGKETRETIKELSKSIKSVTHDIENVIVVGGVTGVYVVDRFYNNVFAFTAFVLTALGLLVSFIVFYRTEIPKIKLKMTLVFGSITFYLALTSSMLFSPTARAYVMSYSGIGLKTSINAEKLTVIEETTMTEKVEKTPPQGNRNNFKPVLVPEKETPELKEIAATDKCLEGYVWREARVSDKVCVTPNRRIEVAQENRSASQRKNPNGGAYGSDTCKSGYVWRDAYPTDHVCVTHESRTKARKENQSANQRRAIH